MYDLIIIGGGPAGLTAAMYARRGGLKTLVVESVVVGGQMNLTGDIENFPSILAINGFDLSNNMLSQCINIGVEVAFEEVLSLELKGNVKKVLTTKNAFEASAIILAMGATPRRMGIENEDVFIGSGVSYCAHCDGNFFKNKEVAVVGGGNTALQDALYLSNICKTVYLVHRRDEFRGNAILSDKLKNHKNIVLKLNSIVKDIAGEPNVKTLQIKNILSKEVEDIALSGIFVAIGMTPNTALVEGLVKMSENGFIETDENMLTSENLVYAVGDIRNKPLRQIVTACGDGATAGADAITRIN